MSDSPTSLRCAYSKNTKALSAEIISPVAKPRANPLTFIWTLIFSKAAAKAEELPESAIASDR